jgi:hypothetical protein
MGRRRLTAAVDWLLRSRTTGRITIAQAPNLPLGLFLAAVAARWLLTPDGWSATGLDVVATGGLVWWAGDELLRGVNPWRRLLGAAVLAGQLRRLLG